MKKSYSYDELSDLVCVAPGCHTRIKKRLAETKPTAIRCFTCHRKLQAKNGHSMSTAREVRAGLKPKRKPRIW